MGELNLPAIKAHIENADDGWIGLVGFANALNATLRDRTDLDESQRSELERLRQLAIDKACS